MNEVADQENQEADEEPSFNIMDSVSESDSEAGGAQFDKSDALLSSCQTVISCKSSFYSGWQVAINVLTVYCVIVTPLSVSFLTDAHLVLVPVENVLNFVFLLNILINSRTSFIDSSSGDVKV